MFLGYFMTIKISMGSQSHKGLPPFVVKNAGHMRTANEFSGLVRILIWVGLNNLWEQKQWFK